VAVDIAKDSLQVQAPAHASRLEYTDEGLHILVDLVNQQTNPLVVFEATGGYERRLIEVLTKQSIPVHLSNPRRIRGFAISEGVRAKTDPIDVGLILAFAREKAARAKSRCKPLTARTHRTDGP
jgi:transposase